MRRGHDEATPFYLDPLHLPKQLRDCHCHLLDF